MLQDHSEQGQDLTADVVEVFHGSCDGTKAMTQLPLPDFGGSIRVVAKAAEQQVKHPVASMLLSVRPKGGIGAS